MSRIETKNDNFTIAFGMDHATGAFVQVWRNPTDMRDCAALIIDNFGVTWDKKQLNRLHKELVDYANTKNRLYCAKVTDTRHGTDFVDQAMIKELAELVGGFSDLEEKLKVIFS